MGLVKGLGAWEPQAEGKIAHITARVQAGKGYHVQKASIQGEDGVPTNQWGWCSVQEQ